MTVPYLFQLQDARAIKKRFNGRCLVAWEQGLGKTFLALFYALRNPELRPAVVVCPAGLKQNWRAEASRHAGLRSDVLEGTTPPKRLPRAAPLTIVNYDILEPWMDYLKGLEPQLIVFDESQYTADRGSKRTKMMRVLCRDVPQVLALSGTPLTNRPAELWSTLNILRPDVWSNFYQFAHRFCSPKRTPWGWSFTGAMNLPELHEKLSATVMIRRRKADVLKQLPASRRLTTLVELPRRKEYDAAARDFIGWLRSRSPGKAKRAEKAEKLVRIGYLLRLVGELKVPVVIDWLKSFLDGGDGKIVVFAVQKKVVESYHEEFADSVMINGDVSQKDREIAKRKFQQDKRTRILVGNMIAAGVGHTLTAAADCAIVELGWTPGAHSQAEKRIDRIGQNKPTTATYILAHGTIEEKIARLNQEKQGVLDATLDGGPVRGGFDVYDRLCEELLRERG